MIDKSAALKMVIDAVRSQRELDGELESLGVDEDAILLGPEALVDSLGLVNVIIEVEQVLLDDHGISVIVVDERAMSLSNSPFRSVGSLASYLVELAGEVS